MSELAGLMYRMKEEGDVGGCLKSVCADVYARCREHIGGYGRSIGNVFRKRRDIDGGSEFSDGYMNIYDRDENPTRKRLNKLWKLTRIIGLAGAIGYTTVILGLWVYANVRGYVYFQGGEPDPSIKYPEWAIGITTILTSIYYLKKELDK